MMIIKDFMIFYDPSLIIPKITVVGNVKPGEKL